MEVKISLVKVDNVFLDWYIRYFKTNNTWHSVYQTCLSPSNCVYIEHIEYYSNKFIKQTTCGHSSHSCYQYLYGGNKGNYVRNMKVLITYSNNDNQLNIVYVGAFFYQIKHFQTIINFQF